jgi:uncharacterized protein YqgC (DUF456 family)
MLKLLLGVVIEVFVGVSLGGLILALTIPLLSRSELLDAHDITARTVVVGVLVAAVAVAVLRPDSAIHRHMKR